MTRRNGALCALIAALALCTAIPVAAEEKVDETRKLAAGGTVVIDNVSGSVEVIGWDKNEVHVTGTLGEAVREFQISGDEERLEFEVKLPENVYNQGHAYLKFQVPRGCRLDVETVSASIDVDDLAGRINLASVSGSIEVKGKAKELDVESVSGSLDLFVETPDLSAETVSGDIDIRMVTGRVKIESVSGDVGIEGENVERIESETVSGDLTFEGSITKDADIDLTSHSGDVSLLLAGNVDARFEVSTYSGDIENNLKESARVSKDKWVKSMEVEFEMGAGSGRVSIETFSGDVELHKK